MLFIVKIGGTHEVIFFMMQCSMPGPSKMMSFCTLQLLNIVWSTCVGVYIDTTAAAAVDSLIVL